MRIEKHPKLNVWVREDGCIYLPQSRGYPPHWTFGSRNSKGYLTVSIKGRSYLVHRLVAEAYFGEIPEGYEIDHISRQRDSNQVWNLRIVTRRENQRNTIKNDRVETLYGVHMYEDEKQYRRAREAHRNRTYKRVRFADGKRHDVPNSEAFLLLAMPVKERIYKG